MTDLTSRSTRSSHLSLQSGTSQTWWRPQQLRWPVWRPGMRAAGGAGWRCLCLLLPEEQVNSGNRIRDLLLQQTTHGIRGSSAVRLHWGSATCDLRSPWKQPPAELCWQLFHVNTPSTPQTSLCPAQPGQRHPWNNTSPNKLKSCWLHFFFVLYASPPKSNCE